MNTLFNKGWCSLLIHRASGVPNFFIFLLIILLIVLGIAISMSVKTKELVRENKKSKATAKEEDLSSYQQNLDSCQIDILLKRKVHDTQNTIAGFKSKGYLPVYATIMI